MGSKCTPSALIVRFLYPNSIKSLAITTLLAFNISLSLFFYVYFLLRGQRKKLWKVWRLHLQAVSINSQCSTGHP